jgi:hypothetical protein
VRFDTDGLQEDLKFADFSMVVRHGSDASVYTCICMGDVANIHRFPYRNDVLTQVSSIANRVKEFARGEYDKTVC